MAFTRAVLCGCALAVWLAGCSAEPLRKDVIAQAQRDGEIAFDVVKIDEAVVTTLLAQPRPAFDDRFKKYIPSPDLKIAAGDVISVIVWESAANGLFGNSLTELSLPTGGAAALTPGLRQVPATGNATRLLESAIVSPEAVAQLLGATSGQLAPPASRDNTTAFDQNQTGQNQTGQRQDRQEQGAGETPARSANGLPSQSLNAATLPNVEQLLQLAEQTGRPGTRIPDQQVGPDGAITIPFIGRVEAAGRTPEQVQRTIEQRLGPKALDPQALVIVRRSTANTVSVAGDIIGGARVPVPPGGDRLLQVIAAAGGAKAPVHETFVRLSRGEVTATVALDTLVQHPDQDVFVEPGDVLTLVRRPKTFSVFGATGKNTAITFASEKLSLTEALAKAGGLLDERADPRGVFLFRYEPVSIVKALGQPVATRAPDGMSPIVYRLDLSEAKSYLLARQFPVRDQDIIFVANAEILPIYKFFQVLNKVVGPVETGLLVCTNNKC